MFASKLLSFLATCSAAIGAALPLESRTDLTARGPGGLSNTFQWSSSGPLIAPTADGRNIAAFKDPSIVYSGGKYHVFVSTASSSGYNLAYLSFTDFNTASSAKPYYLDQSKIGQGYRAAPQIFYFAPQKLWYLVFQNGNCAYSTNSDISNPAGWSAPKNFFTQTPTIVSQNIGKGNWLDMWVICDASTCHLFSSDDNGHLYRSSTPLSQFPNGFGNGANTVIALSDSNIYSLFEASNVYSLGSGNGYLLLVEAIGSAGRYFRSWTATSLSGPWKTLASTESTPFAGANNVKFSGTAWTKSISHGELIRSGTDQNLVVNPCKLRYFYQGLDPSKANGNYDTQPWKLGLLTQTNSAC